MRVNDVMHAGRRGQSFLRLVGFVAACFLIPCTLHAADPRPSAICQPTLTDDLGPFYKPGAPIRDKVGEGYVLRGVVRSAAQCQPLPGAMIEFWLAGPDGRYRDAYRARLRAGEMGQYQFESPVPGGYFGRPSHIHMRVSAPGHQILVTQHYPVAGQITATFDLVLRPAH